jgi:hypothetical protein
MLHNSTFDEAIQNVEKGNALGETMKDFAPVGIYCKPNVFTQSNRSGEVFALCEQDQNTNR